MTKHKACKTGSPLARQGERARINASEIPPPAVQPAADRKCAKLSTSLFKTDLARLNEICSYMATRGHRLSISQVVKVALRTAPLSDDLVAALTAIRAEDGRVASSPGRIRVRGGERGVEEVLK